MIEHPYADGILFGSITPVDPATTPGQTYAFLVIAGPHSAYATDFPEAIEVAADLVRLSRNTEDPQ